MRQSYRTALLFWFLLCPAFAQDRGNIEGTVSDSSGAVVPAAKARIIQTGTNAGWSFVANDVGRYYAPNLPLGRYRVTVQKEGFSTATSDVVEISSQVNVRVDIRLQPGSITDTVQVTSQADLLDTATATVSASVSTKQLHELPFISFGQKADIANYLQYLPGAENTPALTGAPAGSSVTPIMDGAQAYISEVFVDGAPASDGVFRGSLWENGAAVNHYG